MTDITKPQYLVGVNEYTLTGVVIKKLDNEEINGALHQRFVVCQEDGITVLVTINLVKGTKVGIEEGDKVTAKGLYVWDSRGGYLHEIYGSGYCKVLEHKTSPYPRALAAFRLHAHNQSNRYVEVTGHVKRLLRTDTDSTPHQKFTIETALKQSVLVVVNLEHTPHIDVAVGDTVEIAGTYVWNEFGGLIHITHHDHFHKHPDGWIYVPRFGKLFQ